jgi:site-specific DNA-adenine methylase
LNYIGSKHRLKHDLIPIITKHLTPSRTYIEPFCGGASVIRSITGTNKLIANDNNPYLISMWKNLQSGWIPDTYYSRLKYLDIKLDFKRNGNKYSDYIKGYCGYVCSFSSFFFHDYNSDVYNKQDYQKLARHRCLYNESYSSKNTKEGKATNLENISFLNLDYTKLRIPENSIVYADSPYKGCTRDGYFSKTFDHNKYYTWLLETSCINGVEIYISELYMPSEDFEVVWKKKIIYSLRKNCASEKLYKVKRGSINRVKKLNAFLISFFTALLGRIKKGIKYIRDISGIFISNILILILLYFTDTEYRSNSPPKVISHID